MASTKLKRKALKNRARAKKRVVTIKRLSRMPVIKNVDIEKIKEGFSNLKSSNTKIEAAETASAPVQEEAVKKADEAVAEVKKTIDSDTKGGKPVAASKKNETAKAKTTAAKKASPKTKAASKLSKPAKDKSEGDE